MKINITKISLILWMEQLNDVVNESEQNLYLWSQIPKFGYAVDKFLSHDL